MVVTLYPESTRMKGVIANLFPAHIQNLRKFRFPSYAPKCQLNQTKQLNLSQSIV